jgi:hypothetical protein
MMTLGRVYGFAKGLSSRPGETLRRFDLPADAPLVPALSGIDQAVFLKTHGLPEDDQTPVLYLVRDGRDAVVSYAHYVRGRGTRSFKGLDFETALERIIKHGHALKERPGQVPPGVTWSDHIQAWTARSAPTELVRFEELIDDPPGTVARGLEGLRIDVPERQHELPSFQELRKRRDPIMFRRGEAGAWRDEMPPRLQELFWELNQPQMEALGYSRT